MLLVDSSVFGNADVLVRWLVRKWLLDIDYLSMYPAEKKRKVRSWKVMHLLELYVHPSVRVHGWHFLISHSGSFWVVAMGILS